MTNNKTFAIIGGDARQIFCGKKLTDSGNTVYYFGFDKYTEKSDSLNISENLEDVVTKCKYIILPVPCSSDGFYINMPLSNTQLSIDKLFSLLNKNHVVLCGKTCDKIEEYNTKEELKVYDYLTREEFQILNAIPTAESAIAIAINEFPETLCGTNCLVMGYGRIGKILTKLLKSFGANVYVSARKFSDFAWIESEGALFVETDKVYSVINKCKIIFNTIPKKILKDELLYKINKNSLIIDLASKPGGVDFEPAKKVGLNVIWALSLPGKTSPVSAGKIISNTVLNIIKETEG